MGFFDFITEPVSNIVGGVLGVGGEVASNKASAKQAALGRVHSDRQMQNRHQWEVADLKKAGLNPILSAGGTPGTGSSPTAQQGNIASGLNETINTALVEKRLKAEIDNIKADTSKKFSERNNAEAQAVLHQYAIPEARTSAEWINSKAGRATFATGKMLSAAGSVAGGAVGGYLGSKRKGN